MTAALVALVLALSPAGARHLHGRRAHRRLGTGPRPRRVASRLELLAEAARRRITRRDLTGTRQRRYQAGLAVALEETARSLRSGRSLRDAFRDAAAVAPAPARDELAGIVARLDAGVPWAEGMAWWRAQATDPVVPLAAGALALAADAGGPRARVVDQVAATLRERLTLEAELRAQAAQARLSAVVLVVAPLVFAVLSASIDPRVLGFLVATPVGALCLASGLLLDVAGGWWMLRLTRRVMR